VTVVSTLFCADLERQLGGPSQPRGYCAGAHMVSRSASEARGCGVYLGKLEEIQ
jgi:hypothetical protein